VSQFVITGVVQPLAMRTQLVSHIDKSGRPVRAMIGLYYRTATPELDTQGGRCGKLRAGRARRRRTGRGVRLANDERTTRAEPFPREARNCVVHLFAIDRFKPIRRFDLRCGLAPFTSFDSGGKM
jgi:hypothetical protein